MNIYLLEQDHVYGYDTFDSCVVAAETLEDATLIRPDGEQWNNPTGDYCSWPKFPKHIRVTRLGLAVVDTKEGIILSSFNAG